MEAIEQLCEEFKPIHLEKMNKVRLMNRKEIKYTVRRDLLPLILQKVSPHYDILEIAGENLMPYKSVYYDTDDYKLYTTHQNGKLNRYKVRNRTYELTGAQYLEIKFKNNKRRTIKNRIPIEKKSNGEKERAFAKENLPPDILDLKEKLTVNYQRLMLVDHARTERVTIDLNLKCSNHDQENSYDDMVVIEIKHEGDLNNSVIANVLSELNIKNISFSKYCLGISGLYSDVKKNAMKLKMRHIQKTLSLQKDIILQKESQTNAKCS
jgi:hypothetical protein